MRLVTVSWLLISCTLEVLIIPPIDMGWVEIASKPGPDETRSWF